ncbi:MAG: 5-formyltetrahydrofolate cyclo-ligase [Sphaerochaetaceae bacterium]|jgi:5-formyltetrahydrofolate cyclo-ligase
MELSRQKQQLREQMRHRFSLVSSQQLASDSLAIVKRILELPVYKHSSLVLGFVPLADEPDVQVVYDTALAQGKSVGLPVAFAKGRLHFYSVSEKWRTSLEPNRWGIGEPKQEHAVSVDFSLHQSILLLVPAVAFTVHKERLGRGKGYYDRFLATSLPTMRAVGVCFEHQVVENLPTAKNDRPVDILVTPKTVF